MYDYKLIEGLNYPLFSFSTKFNHEYQVSFNTLAFVFKDIMVYSISVDCLYPGDKTKDVSVGETVHSIISNFISENNNCLFSYICESLDGKELLRQRKFNGWYLLHGNSNHILKNFDIYIEEFDITYYTSIIFDSHIYDADFVEKIYNTEIKELTNKN